MPADTPLDLVGLLVMWHQSASHWLPVAGYPQECPSTAGYRTSRQYDDGNGAGEADERHRLVLHIGHAIDRVAEPYRTALCILARNRSTGSAAWHSPRLPTDADARAEMVSEALDLLAEEI